ncbi:MAG TPA: anti-sigma factor [Thermoanaerobaculia bacterium]|nr:anti-sigma factor [Thermoanaerobaculia bacterium]
MADTPHSARFEELLPAYALGALDGEELRELEAHLDGGCPDCRRLLALWDRDLEALAEAVEPVEPSATTRARILRLGATAPPARARQPLLPWLSLAAAALLVAAVWGIAGQLRLRGELERLTMERDRLARQVTALDQQVTLARSAAERANQALQVLAAPGVQSVVLAGLGPATQAAGHTYVNPRRHDALFYAFDLPPLPRDKTYQLWFIAAGKPVSAGTFAVDARGTGSLRVDQVADVASIQAWAVTVEPAGGVPQPTGTMVLKTTVLKG